MVLSTRRKKDHGEFRIRVDDASEIDIIQKLVTEARRNMVRPGHAWCRLNLAGEGRAVASHEFHVDLHALIVEVWEMSDGVETARRTYDLVDMPS